MKAAATLGFLMQRALLASLFAIALLTIALTLCLLAAHHLVSVATRVGSCRIIYTST